jgi:opacity protein-like surface antigen
MQNDARPLDPDRELVSGSFNEDFLAMYTGALYTAELWSANARLERRESDSEEHNSLLVGWYRQPAMGHGLSAGLTVFQNRGASGDTVAADLKFGWAYRKSDGKWAFLDRIDLIHEKTQLPQQTQTSWRLINNFNANRRFSARTQMSLQYAFKYVRSDFDGNGYSGYTDLAGVDWRYNFAQRWDAGVNTSVYHSYRADVTDYGAGVDLGFNIVDNMWVTLGYNLTGFHDADFSDARYTAQGPYLRFSVKADQQLLKRITGRR